MAKVTSKLQVTIPKAVAERYGISPGDEIEFRPAGTEIRIVPPRLEVKRLSREERLRMFDEATECFAERWRDSPLADGPVDRGWTREDLYARGTPARPLGSPKSEAERPDEPD